MAAYARARQPPHTARNSQAPQSPPSREGSRKASKSGAPEDLLDTILAYLQNAGCFAVMGLMAMAPRSADPQATRLHFRRLRALRDERRSRGLLLPGAGLSMGMSDDFQVAIEEGATIVRIGTLLFDGLGAGETH